MFGFVSLQVMQMLARVDFANNGTTSWVQRYRLQSVSALIIVIYSIASQQNLACSSKTRNRYGQHPCRCTKRDS